MSIEKVRKDFHKLIDEIQSEEILKAYQTALKNEKKEEKKLGWNDLSQMERDGINRGLKDAQAGRVHTHEEVDKAIKDEFGI